MKDIANILKPIEKPLEKLIDAVRSGCGIIYEPRAIRKHADAESYAQQRAAYTQQCIESGQYPALQDAQNELSPQIHSLEQRACERVKYTELDRQANLDAIVEIAAEGIKNDEKISEEPVNEDWLRRFFKEAQDISENDARQIWGKILAKEVAKPKTFSKRTLDIIRNLEADEAKIFEKICNYIIDGDCIIRLNENILEPFVSFFEILTLKRIGLIESTDMIAIKYTKGKPYHIDYFDKLIPFKCLKAFSLNVYSFTPEALELQSIITADYNKEYYSLIVNHLNEKQKNGYLELNPTT